MYKKNFDGISNEVDFDTIKKNIYIEGNYAIELYENEKIINLNIPHGEMYCNCTFEEWLEITQYVKDLGVKTKAELDRSNDGVTRVKIVCKNKFDGKSKEVDFQTIKDSITLDKDYTIEFFKYKRIINLAFSDGPIYCDCNLAQWHEIVHYINALGIDSYNK